MDVADRAAVFEALLRYRPDVVFHAAAHKHVPVLETHPVEAVNVNVYGTLNVVEAAIAAGVQRFVLISTDKAVQPISVMGASKRLAEDVVLAHAPASACYSVVRFGNVLGSRGSVIPTFARQIAAGGPITVTDPRMTRFFMSVEEAVQLVLQASVLSEGGEIFMLEMGEPVRILDLAQRMIRLSGCRTGHRHPHPHDRPPTGREARRGAVHARRGDLPHLAPLHPPARAGPHVRGLGDRGLSSCARPPPAATPPSSGTCCSPWSPPEHEVEPHTTNETAGADAGSRLGVNEPTRLATRRTR